MVDTETPACPICDLTSLKFDPIQSFAMGSSCWMSLGEDLMAILCPTHLESFVVAQLEVTKALLHSRGEEMDDELKQVAADLLRSN